MEHITYSSEHQVMRPGEHESTAQPDCYTLPGLANLSTLSDDKEFMKYPMRDNFEDEDCALSDTLGPPYRRESEHQYTRYTISSSESDSQSTMAEISHKDPSMGTMRNDGMTQLGYEYHTWHPAIRDNRKYDEEADIRSSMSSRALSEEFMENYREYLGPEDCAVGRSSKEIAIPHFTSHNSRKADFILGLHIASMQALAAGDSDDSIDEDLAARVGAVTSGSQLPRARRRNDSVIERPKTPIDEQATATEMKIQPQVQHHTPMTDGLSKRDSPPFGFISCEKQPPNVARTTSPFLERLSILDLKAMLRNSVLPDAEPSQTNEPASVITLFVTRRYAQSGRLMSCITIPAISNSPGKISETSEKHFTSLDFDDEVFVRRVKREYYKTLLGRGCFARFWRRWLSARALKRISIATENPAAEELAETCAPGVARHNGVRGSRIVAEQSLDTVFSDEQLFRLFQNPKLGTARYAWVHWAHRVAANPLGDDEPLMNEHPDQTSWHRTQQHSNGESKRQESLQHALDIQTLLGLEFVEGWSPRRIITAVAIIILSGVAAALLWIFLGPASPGNSWTVVTIGNSQSWTDATHRVGGGLLMGGLIIIFGCILLGSWVVVSWIWMS